MSIIKCGDLIWSIELCLFQSRNWFFSCWGFLFFSIYFLLLFFPWAAFMSLLSVFFLFHSDGISGEKKNPILVLTWLFLCMTKRFNMKNVMNRQTNKRNKYNMNSNNNQSAVSLWYLDAFVFRWSWSTTQNEWRTDKNRWLTKIWTIIFFYALSLFGYLSNWFRDVSLRRSFRFKIKEEIYDLFLKKKIKKFSSRM